MGRVPLATVLAFAPRLNRRSTTCLFCQHRFLHNTLQRSHATSSATASPTLSKNSTTSESTPSQSGAAPLSPDPKQIVTPQRAKRPHVRAYDGELVPQPLNRPLGLPHPPQPGQNSGRDARTWKQRREDFASYDKHIERRQDLIKNLYEKNYFRDIGNLGRIHKGKSILAPTTPFRAHLARYFPNLQGRTLQPSSTSTADTTPVLRGRVSVVSVLNTEWARSQCQSFISETANPELHTVLRASSGVAQSVEVNVEENPVKRSLIRICIPWIRRRFSEGDWGKYFLVGQGLSDEIREALGIWNGKVGYVYLLDAHCKVRWAGNGNAREDEKTSLVNCLKRLVDEARVAKGMGARVVRHDARPTGKLMPAALENAAPQRQVAG